MKRLISNYSASHSDPSHLHKVLGLRLVGKGLKSKVHIILLDNDLKLVRVNLIGGYFIWSTVTSFFNKICMV